MCIYAKYSIIAKPMNLYFVICGCNKIYNYSFILEMNIILFGKKTSFVNVIIEIFCIKGIFTLKS